MILQQRVKARRGNILALTTLGLIGLLGTVALAIDIGMLAIARAQCQNSADAPLSLAACRTITGDSENNYNLDAVPGAAIRTAQNNKIFGKTLNGDPDTDWHPTDPVEKAKVHPKDHIFNSGQVKVEIGSYSYSFNDFDPNSEKFNLQLPRTDTTEPYRAVRVTVSYAGDWSFAGVFGLNGFNTAAVATAVHRPRDIVIIMDLSGSMRFQSLPGGPYYGSRTFSMNPESIFPLFGHYSDEAGAALQGTSSKQTGSGEYYDPSNISTKTNSGPPIAEYFFKNPDGSLPDATTRALRSPDSYSTTPGGDNYLKVTKNTGGTYARTLAEVVGSIPADINAFAASGYDLYLGPNGFKGYTQGPGYWGKTFFIWPPDPRATSTTVTDNGAKDWRQRFFFKRNSSGTLFPLDQNTVFWNASTGAIRGPGSSSITVAENGNSVSYSYRVNYAAILKWLDTDPKPFPSILRAGRIKYYDALPDYNDANLNTRWWSTSTNSLTNLNERFWKGYIDFVLGFDQNGNSVQDKIGNGNTFTWGSLQLKQKPDYEQHGQINNSSGYAAGHAGTLAIDNMVGVLGNDYNPAVGSYVRIGDDPTIYQITARSNWTSSNEQVTLTLDRPLASFAGNNAKVKFYKTYPTYLDLTDNPKRPKHHLWFGPMTMIDYLGNYNTDQFWWPGNVPEAQSWACKVGIQTAIDDIKKNHPNDFVGMTFFSSPQYSNKGSGQHNQAVVPLGRNYQLLKDSLWFPPSTVVGGVKEITPWDADFTQVPRAKGGTAPGMGFMIAYNLFSNSTDLRFYSQPQPQYRGVAGGLGRKGAGRIVIFETDGAPNTRAFAKMAGSGNDSYYPIRLKNPQNLADSQNVEWPSSGSYSNKEVIDVVKQITAPVTASPPGYSTPRKKALVYCIAFGTLFDPVNSSDPDQKDGLNFLQTIHYWGNTATTTDGFAFPPNQRVYGTHAERVARMQAAFTSILQGGVQVSLIE